VTSYGAGLSDSERKALELARDAFRQGSVPVGAVVADVPWAEVAGDLLAAV